MTIKTIGLIAAMPEEIRPLLKRVGPLRQQKLADFWLYRFNCGNKEVGLVESGIGTARAAKASRALIEALSPDVILNFGFGGAALPGPAPGDIVLADRLLFFKERLFSEQAGLDRALTTALATILTEDVNPRYRVFQGTFVTTGEIIGKKTLAGLLPADAAPPLLEMETAAVARVALERKIPMAAVRAISDGAEEELDFSISDFTDRDMRVSALKVLCSIARKPRIIPQLARLERNSRLAGENLAQAILTIIGGVQDVPSS